MHIKISKFLKLNFVEEQSGHTIKNLRMNKGNEFITCDDFLKKYGIEYQLSAKYTL